MSKHHEILKNVKKSPAKTIKEKRAEKREKKMMKDHPVSIVKAIEEKEK